MPWFRERELHDILRHHAVTSGSDVGRVKAIGAITYPALDNLVVQDQGTALDPESVVPLPFDGDRPVFPALDREQDDTFIRKLAVPLRSMWPALICH